MVRPVEDTDRKPDCVGGMQVGQLHQPATELGRLGRRRGTTAAGPEQRHALCLLAFGEGDKREHAADAGNAQVTGGTGQ